MESASRRRRRLPRAGATMTAVLGLFLAFVPAGRASAQDMACTECHNPHGVDVPHNDVCTDTGCLESCHAKDLSRLKHPTGPGTPLQPDRTQTCNACHNLPFAGVYHPYRIHTAAGSPAPAGTADVNQACGWCHGGGTDAATTPPLDGVPYMNRSQLAGLATGIHADAPLVSFGYRIGSPDTLVVSVDASATICFNGCDLYDWDWGDGSAHDSGVTATHRYAGAGSWTITLTVTDTGIGRASDARQVTLVAPDLPPVVAGTCAFDENTWTATVTDASTDDRRVTGVTVSWGDGSTLSTDTTAPFGPFTHLYQNALGPYTITHKAIDSAGQSSQRTCSVSPAYFTIAGVVRSRTGTLLGSATVVVRRSGAVVKTVYTNASGAFTAGSLKPGDYTLIVTRVGYTFAVPAATMVLGPSRTDVVVSAIAPLTGPSPGTPRSSPILQTNDP